MSDRIWMTPREAADALGMDVSTLRRKRREGWIDGRHVISHGERSFRYRRVYIMQLQEDLTMGVAS